MSLQKSSKTLCLRQCCVTEQVDWKQCRIQAIAASVSPLLPSSCATSSETVGDNKVASQVQGVLGFFSAFGMKCHSYYSSLKRGKKKQQEKKKKNISGQGWAALVVSWKCLLQSDFFS